MRVAIVTESFLPQVNGVSNTVRHVVDRLVATGHSPLVITPGQGPDQYNGVPVVRTRSMPLPGYPDFALGLPDRRVARTLEAFEPDVVHLASPIALGFVGLRAAERLGIPTVAVYQTDVSGFAEQYGVKSETLVDRWVGRLHRRCDRTLVPSLASHKQLTELGVPDLHVWRRGVSLDLFDPQRRSAATRNEWQATGNEVVIGYVGRLAPEKQLRRLVDLVQIPGTRLVIIGDGPERSWLEKHLPSAHFTGMLSGAALATAFASLDVFVHTGEAETFCQTIQEAQASGVPVVAPASGGPLDLIDHGRTGLLYDPARRTSLRQRICSLVNDPPLRRDLAASGVAAVQNRSWPRLVDELISQHYAAVISGPSRSVAA